ncbi:MULTISPECIES: hypothetical protein [Microcystis]|uniref:Protoporphyrin IX Mg-chelatase subunit H n=1 Tax=Microcystis aeruginosa NIES-44 TaxID=449439 RepID=A0A0A1W153_MICAE|nr:MULTISPECIES: hypothetical protein [Microcystis]MBD2115537.1 hypothetical protein [Microcystis wesenbergii FACHB-1339]GAL95720.1 protoporphyrin IX Mg-chelatase subunit H [Microcystis aeruginosa NIES-44]
MQGGTWFVGCQLEVNGRGYWETSQENLVMINIEEARKLWIETVYFSSSFCVGWVERSETQQLRVSVGFRDLNPTYELT